MELEKIIFFNFFNVMKLEKMILFLFRNIMKYRKKTLHDKHIHIMNLFV